MHGGTGGGGGGGGHIFMFFLKEWHGRISPNFVGIIHHG